MKNILIAIFITAILYTFWFAGNYPKAFYYIDLAYGIVGEVLGDAADNVAAVLLHKPVTAKELQSKYNAPAPKKVKILLVPGHEPDFGGTEYRGIKEREMNVELANELRNFLENNGNYEVIVARTNDDWNPILLNYFKTNWDDIISFFRDNKNETLHLVSVGKKEKPVTTVYHNSAKPDVALRLYGINKWETENNIDIAIHVHFNDVPRNDTSVPGEYSGFTIYIPEKSYANSAITKDVAGDIFKRLSKYNAVSDLPVESDGLVEDGALIALGAYNTTNSASMLIEYGYIYEPQFANPTVRSTTIRDLAFQTYLGLQDFFGSGNDVSFAYDTLMLPHRWSGEITKSKGEPRDVLSLQTALLLDGVYPAAGRSMNDCPRTGKVGPCTLDAISAFQKKNNIKGEEGVVGAKTLEVLNKKYSVRAI